MTRAPAAVQIRNTQQQDFPGIIELCQAVYPFSKPYGEEQLASQVGMFPEGQFVAVASDSGKVVGMAASLIVLWDEYDLDTSWRDFTEHGMFTNHDPEHGRTLYAAEIMVHPSSQGLGIGRQLYAARRDLVRRLKLRRIRAGARLRGYHRHAGQMSVEEYARKVVRGEIKDPTVTFQIRQGFHIVGIIPGYLRNDPESLGHAAVIEWVNPEVAEPQDEAGWDHRFDPDFNPP